MLEHLIQETQNFSYIQFDGRTVITTANNANDAKIALKELRILKKLVNAEKKSLNNELRDTRAKAASLKATFSTPRRSKVLMWSRWAIRVGSYSVTDPLEDRKTEYNTLLLECDKIQLMLERL